MLVQTLLLTAKVGASDETYICEEGVTRSHDTDCGLYYQCSVGEYITRACPEGLHFNPRESACDYPSSAGCQLGPVPTNAPATQPPATEVPATEIPETQPPTPQPPATETPETQPPPPQTSSCTDSVDGTTFPHPNCGMFYICSAGIAFESPCPGGLHWSVSIDMCDFPEAAECIEGAAPYQPGGIPITEPQTDSPIAVTTPAQPPINPDGSCPAYNVPGTLVHLAHPDCNRFYVCDWGIPYEMICPDNTHFNIKINVCDAPIEANCTPGAAIEQPGAVRP